MRSVANSVSGKFAPLFPFPFFNRMQSDVLPSLLESDENIVVAAPTAAGKTVLAELAIVRELSKPRRGKILYLAPLRALTNEKEGDWQALFTPMGFEVYVVSGERELDPSKAHSAHVIISTPEKWDSSSRKHSSMYAFVRDVSVIIIDEAHLLDSDDRGGVLEALITRMKRIKDNKVRIIALSATMPNVREVAQWIGASEKCTFAFDDTYRPVPLTADVFAYNPGKNKFVDKYIRLYKAVSLIEPQLPYGQALIFVATRSDTTQAASKLTEIFSTKKMPLTTPETEHVASAIRSKSLREAVSHGIGFHHAGLPKQDRDIVEAAFKAGDIKVLVSTSTLAWGVNLPARVVVIRDIANEAIDQEISSLDLLQMLGRAGRPQYDDRGFGWIIAPRNRAQDFLRMLNKGSCIRSQLHKTLSEHLNAEISMGTIKSRADARTWLDGTFYYVQHPQSSVLLNDHIHGLVEHGFAVEANEHLAPTDLGRLASRYYLRLSTAQSFRQLKERPTDDELLDAVSSAEEFADVVVRRNELATIKRMLPSYNGAKSKVRAILRAYIERGEVPEVLRSDAWLIKQNALRLLSALEAFLFRFNTPESVLRAKILALRVEYGAPEELCPLLQLDGLGVKQASQLYAAGVRAPSDITSALLSRLVAGTRVARAVRDLPAITLDVHLPDSIPYGKSLMGQATVTNSGRGTRVAVSVYANQFTMLQDAFYLAKGSFKSIPIGVYGSEHTQVSYQVKADLLDCIANPLTHERVVAVTGLPAARTEPAESSSVRTNIAETPDSGHPRQQEHYSAPRGDEPAPLGQRISQHLTPAKLSDRRSSNAPESVVGRCKHCGSSLHREQNVIACDCGVSYKLPVRSELAENPCNCGLPKFTLNLFGVDICIDRKCESTEDVIARRFAAGEFTCPRCHGPLTVVRRKGIIVGCVRYYDGCKTAFLLPTNAAIVGRCSCGLPKLQLKTKTRCLDTTCRA